MKRRPVDLYYDILVVFAINNIGLTMNNIVKTIQKTTSYNNKERILKMITHLQKSGILEKTKARQGQKQIQILTPDGRVIVNWIREINKFNHDLKIFRSEKRKFQRLIDIGIDFSELQEYFSNLPESSPPVPTIAIDFSELQEYFSNLSQREYLMKRREDSELIEIHENGNLKPSIKNREKELTVKELNRIKIEKIVEQVKPNGTSEEKNILRKEIKKDLDYVRRMRLAGIEYDLYTEKSLLDEYFENLKEKDIDKKILDVEKKISDIEKIFEKKTYINKIKNQLVNKGWTEGEIIRIHDFKKDLDSIESFLFRNVFLMLFSKFIFFTLKYKNINLQITELISKIFFEQSILLLNDITIEDFNKVKSEYHTNHYHPLKAYNIDHKVYEEFICFFNNKNSCFFNRHLNNSIMKEPFISLANMIEQERSAWIKKSLLNKI